MRRLLQRFWRWLHEPALGGRWYPPDHFIAGDVDPMPQQSYTEEYGPEQKRRKAQPTEVPRSELPQQLRDAIKGDTE